MNFIFTGSKDIASSDSLSVYPNPNNGTFVIKAISKLVYSIMNIVGQTISKGILTKANNFSFDVKGLSCDVYFVLGYGNNIATKHKIVIMEFQLNKNKCTFSGLYLASCRIQA